MKADHDLHSAEILRFVPRTARPQVTENRFTTADRIDVMQWEAKVQGVRLEIHRRHDDDPPEIGEFASIYPANGRWAAWGAVRKGGNISVWRSQDGRDIGQFSTMSEALEAVSGTASLPAKRQA